MDISYDKVRWHEWILRLEEVFYKTDSKSFYIRDGKDDEVDNL